MNVQPKPLVRNLGLTPPPDASDGRQLDFVLYFVMRAHNKLCAHIVVFVLYFVIFT